MVLRFSFPQRRDSVTLAQSAEQRIFNPWVKGSSPLRCTSFRSDLDLQA